MGVLHNLPWYEVTLRLGIALAFAAVIGWERERKARPAGLRTNMLVALGASTFTVISIAMFEQFMADPGQSQPVDPTRIIAGIVGGIGFLGAGAIMQGRQRVHGMTTAAGIWVVAAVGVASGAGYYLIAGVCMVMAVFTLIVVRWAEGAMNASPKTKRDTPPPPHSPE